jgi:flagellar biosynthesis protein FlhF
VNGQVEILALAEDDMAAIPVPEAETVAPAKTATNIFTAPGRFGFSGKAKVAAEPVSPVFQAEKQAEKQVDIQDSVYTKHASRTTAPQQPAKNPARQQAVGQRAQHQDTQLHQQSVSPAQASYPSIQIPSAPGTTELMNELRSMRGMMESQLSEISWGQTQRKEPHKAALLRQMLASGFSVSLSRYLIENLPANTTLEQGLVWIKAMMVRNLSTLGCENDMLEQGGVFALVGPTGVGKTTTTAKLAARCVMRHGANKLGLITTDGYRIGGYEQLRIYGKILGVMVHAVKDQADLEIALAELKNKHTVLIDTVGMSQRDRLVSEQVAMLSGSNVKRLLCLNSTSTGETLSEVVQSYKGTGLAGCILTKLDEAASIGSVLDSVMRQKLTMFYVANGQRVPEDLHVANKQYLVDLAFKMKRETSDWQQYQDDELPLLMAGASASMHDRQLREVSLG